MANYLYTDDGNHQTWVAAHQGGSYSRVSRTQRMFVGSRDIFAAAGGDSFRQDSHLAYDSATALGQQIPDAMTAGSFISTIGIIEDEVTGHGRYFVMKYRDSGGTQKPQSVAAYDSPYTNELVGAALVDSWSPLVSLATFIEQSMRVVHTGLAAGSFLFYATQLPNRKSQINVVSLPDPGQPAHSDAPLTVASLDFEVVDRIYVVPRNGTVWLYLGSSERSLSQKTYALEYDPHANKVTTSIREVVSDQLPFPRSYAACRGRSVFGEDPIHLALEPLRSWVQGAASSIDDDSNVRDTIPPAFRRVTGNAWVLASLNSNGYAVDDSVFFEGSDLKPWMGTAHADSQGGQMRVAAIPKFLERIAPPPDSYAANKTTPQHDSSDAYVLQAQVVVRQEGLLTKQAFVYRKDNIEQIQPAFGNNRATSNVFDESPPDAGSGGSFEDRKLTMLLVPGTILIEPQRAERVDSIPPMRTVSPVANRLRHWGLIDDSVFYGTPIAALLGGLASLDPTDQDQSTDCIHGVQGDIFDPDLTVIVGWFTNGFLPGGPQ